MKHLAKKRAVCYNHGEKEVLETIPEGCTRSMFRNETLFSAGGIAPPVLLEPGRKRRIWTQTQS